MHVQLEAFGECRILDADDKPVAQHFFFEIAVCACLDIAVEHCDVLFCRLAFALASAVEPRTLKNHVATHLKLLVILRDDGVVAPSVLRGYVRRSENVFRIFSEAVEQGANLATLVLFR